MRAEECRIWRERIGALVLGQLSEDERAATEAHLEGCPACRAEADALAPVAALLSRADPDRLAPAPAPPLGRSPSALSPGGRARRRRSPPARGEARSASECTASAPGRSAGYGFVAPTAQGFRRARSAMSTPGTAGGPGRARGGGGEPGAGRGCVRGERRRGGNGDAPRRWGPRQDGLRGRNRPG